MRIANLTHGALYMLGAYIGVSILKSVPNLWLAAILSGLVVALFGGLLERFVLRKLGGNVLGQFLHVVFGYTSTPEVTTFVAWLTYIVVVLALFLRPVRRIPAASSAPVTVQP